MKVKTYPSLDKSFCALCVLTKTDVIHVCFGIVLLCLASCAVPVSDKSGLATDRGKDLLQAISSFTEEWLVEGDMTRAAGYLSAGAIQSQDFANMIKARGEPIDPDAARKVFADLLAGWRAETGRPSSVGEAIHSLPIVDTEIEVLNRNTPDSQWYTVFVLDADTVPELTPNKADVNWLIGQIEDSGLYAQVFTLKSLTRVEDQPLVFVWKREADKWKILAIGTVGT